MNSLLFCLSLLLCTPSALAAAVADASPAASSDASSAASDAVIVEEGDHYTINVAALDPDPEMTLLDVLHLCPDLMSYDGKSLTADYDVSIDNIGIYLDIETFLLNTKASELDHVIIYNFGLITQGTNGQSGLIDIYFKEPQPASTSGKTAAEGSTYGNGKLYADILTQRQNLSVKGYALANARYMKRKPVDGDASTVRSFKEDAHMSLNWNITDDDLLMVKLSQEFYDYKERIHGPEGHDMPETDRIADLAIVYDRMFGEADLWVDIGASYLDKHFSGSKLCQAVPHLVTQLTIPFHNDRTSLIFGTESDYSNIWHVGTKRIHSLFNKAYGQLNLGVGHWLFSLGGRLGMIHYWDHDETSAGGETYAFERHHIHALHASAAYRQGRHTLKGSYSREKYFNNPETEELFNLSFSGRSFHEQDKMSRSELSYSYQQGPMVAMGSLYYAWGDDDNPSNENLMGVRSSVTWLSGPLRLTAGADFYHLNHEEPEADVSSHENFFHLKLMPALMLGHGFRLSSTLVYSSRRTINAAHPHLYAAVKLNKDLSPRCNLYLDFHDIAGMPTMSADQLSEDYLNRALTVGVKWRF